MLVDQLAKIAVVGNQDQVRDVRSLKNIPIRCSGCRFRNRLHIQPGLTQSANYEPVNILVGKQAQNQAALLFAIDFSSATMS